VEGAAADESVQTARSEDDTGIMHLVERRTSCLDPGNKATGDGVAAPTRVFWGPRLDSIAQKGKKRAGIGRGKGNDGRGVKGAIQMPGGMDRGSDRAGPPGLELTAIPSGGAERGGEEEKVYPARGAFGQSRNRSAEAGAPAVVSEMVVPVRNDQAGRVAEENAEIGVGVEEPLAGAGGVRDMGLVRTKARLEMLGVGLEGQEQDAEAEPPTGAAEAGQAQGAALSA